MDFEFTPEQESFRHKVREWLSANLPKDLCVDDPQDERVAPNREVFERRRAWQAKLHAAGCVGLSWPVQSQYTIAGGTSEIQRNIIGERTLGLPKG